MEEEKDMTDWLRWARWRVSRTRRMSRTRALRTRLWNKGGAAPQHVVQACGLAPIAELPRRGHHQRCIDLSPSHLNHAWPWPWTRPLLRAGMLCQLAPPDLTTPAHHDSNLDDVHPSRSNLFNADNRRGTAGVRAPTFTFYPPTHTRAPRWRLHPPVTCLSRPSPPFSPSCDSPARPSRPHTASSRLLPPPCRSKKRPGGRVDN